VPKMTAHGRCSCCGREPPRRVAEQLNQLAERLERAVPEAMKGEERLEYRRS
jgi:hypothetical protein